MAFPTQSGRTAILSITDAQMGGLLDLFAPLIDSFVERVAQRVKQLEEEKEPKYYTRQQVCELLGITLPTLYNYVKRGDLHPFKLNGRTLFDAHTIDDAVKGGRQFKYKKGGAQ